MLLLSTLSLLALFMYCGSWLVDVWLANNTLIPAKATAAPMSSSSPPQGDIGQQDPSSHPDALSVILSASLKDRAAWAADPKACRTALQTELSKPPSPKAHYIKPAVLASTFSQGVIHGSVTGNRGFQHVLSVHSASAWVAAEVQGNVVGGSVLRLVDCDVRVAATRLVGNVVRRGSVVSVNTVVAHFRQVRGC